MDVEGVSIFGDMNYLIGVIRQSTQSFVRAVFYSTLVSCLVWSIFVSEVCTPPPPPSLPSGVEYKVVSWKPDGDERSKSSFVNVALLWIRAGSKDYCTRVRVRVRVL